MEDLPSAPPLDKPRLFLGGLVPAITDDAIRKALSRFGELSSFERHPTRSFAHVSLDLIPDANLEQCVRALDNTKWCGSVLQVQKAHEHYLCRLEKEWRQNQLVTSDEPTEQITKDDQPQPFSNLAKGVHTKFSFPDHHPSEDYAADPASSRDTDLDRDDERFVTHIPPKVPTMKTAKAKPTSVSNALSSTMQLFGLTAEPPRTDELKPMTDHFSVQQKRMPSKRPRTSDETRLQLETAEAIGKDPALINIQAEKSSALSVLESMFPTQTMFASGQISDDRRKVVVDRHRRPGLFRKIQFQLPASSKKEPRRVKRVSVKKRRHSSLPSASAPTADVERTKAKDLSNANTSLRRAGLYKQLMS